MSNFKLQYGASPTRKILTIQVPVEEDSSGIQILMIKHFFIFLELFFVFFSDEPRVDVNFVNEIVDKLRQNNSTKAIIVFRHSITLSAKEVCYFRTLFFISFCLFF